MMMLITQNDEFFLVQQYKETVIVDTKETL
jgi:hypothetical protein